MPNLARLVDVLAEALKMTHSSLSASASRRSACCSCSLIVKATLLLGPRTLLELLAQVGDGIGPPQRSSAPRRQVSVAGGIAFGLLAMLCSIRSS